VRIRAAGLALDRIGPFRQAAPPDLPLRDYFDRYPQAPGDAIDTVAGIATWETQGAPIVVAAGGPVTVTGWAVDIAARDRAGGVEVVLDDGQAFPAHYGEARDDVARNLCGAAYTRSGFTATIPAGALVPGNHTLTLRILSRDRQAVYPSARQVMIQVR
jgi:hypothetical protein